MNRTAERRRRAGSLLLLAALVAAVPGRAQEPDAKAETPPIEGFVEALRQLEARVKSLELDLETSGKLAGGLDFTTRGTLRVLRPEQGAAARVHSFVEFRFGDGLAGSTESLRTPDELLVLQQDPTFGEVYVRIDAMVLADLEWAGRVLQKQDLPFVEQGLAGSPLGSAMLGDLVRRFDLKPIERPTEGGQKGTWYGGDRKKAAGLEEEGAELPVSDRVELFLRDGDHVLTEVVHKQGDDVVQRIRVRRLALDEPLAAEALRMRDPVKKPRDVKEHAPMWQSIEQTVQRAMQKKEGELPPSKR